MTVLLVDSHPDTVCLMVRIVRRMGHDALTAATLHDTRLLCEFGEYELLIADIRLNDGDCYELAGIAKRKGAMAFTSLGTTEDIVETHDAGFDAHLIKPASVETIEHAIEGVLSGQVTGWVQNPCTVA